MALQVHPTIPIDLTPEQAFEYDNGILHALLSEAPTITIQYWIMTRSIIPTFMQDQREAGYNILYFNPFLTKAAWTRLYPDQPFTNTISARLADMDSLTISSLSFSVSTLPTPVTPSKRDYTSNDPANPMAALITLMNQMLQKNAMMMPPL